MDKRLYRVSYLPGNRERTIAELDKREIPYVPAKGNRDSVLVNLSPGRADELRGLEGISSVLKMFEGEE